ncbi:hypothetical protein GCM10007940_35580 [Portibacter lacus]|uniref:Bacterial surface antigen (D15) domain-containing protein n=2 Tax=Portibacter lacus TaxID=1099794 RepID=A0AA37WFT2_9BACT|nr:hypothetical protein GCM10007940_35580 [Portibacter lacus]
MPILSGQSINTTFGKNRVQYHNNFKYWWVYETQNFKTYWYDRGKFVGVPTLQLAEMDFNEIQEILEHRMNDKIEIIVYSDLTDLKMSNIGLEETFITVAGRTKVANNKVFVYFDGNHNNLRKQIRQGVAEVFINSMLYGNSFQEIVQNAVMFNVPEWYRQGISKYVETEWDETADDNLRHYLTREKRKYKNFKRLSKDHPQLAGHSFWKFIGDTYGKSSISNLLYLTRINRNMEAAFIYVIGVPFKQLREDWYAYYLQQYKDLNPKLNPIDAEDVLKAKIAKRSEISDIKISADGNYASFVENRIGKYRVFVYDFQEDAQFSVLKVGKKNPFEITDYDYPVVSWSESGSEISLIYEKRDIVYQKRINLETDEVINDLFAPEYRRVYSADYINQEEMIISATTDGFSDLYLYNIRNRQSTRIINDFYDDLDVKSATLLGKKGILFSSNRTDDYIIDRKLDTILPIAKFDVFFLAIDSSDYKLYRISKTPGENDRQPIALSGNKIAYLSGGSGIVNRKIAQIEELGVLPQAYYNSNELSNISEHDGEKGKYLYVERYGRKDAIVRDSIDFSKVENPAVTEFKRVAKGLKKVDVNINDNEPDVVHIESSRFIDPEYYFQTEFNEKAKSEEPTLDFNIFSPQTATKPLIQEKAKNNIVKFVNSRATAARLRFRIDDVVSRMDNSVLFEGLDSYAGDRQESYQHQPFGYLVKANVKDIFEDYAFEGGIRLPTSLNGSEAFLTFDDKKKRIDKRYALYRRAIAERPEFFANPNLSTQKNTTIAMYQLRYPFDFFTSVRASLTYRTDNFFDLVSEQANLEAPKITGQRLGLKLEYIYDNSFDIDVNIKNGTRYKFYVEGVNSMNINLSPPIEFNLSKAFMTVVGTDIRHYIPIGKYGVWANRFAAATNFGSERTLYYLGGVESWLGPVFAQDTPTPQNNYAYTAVAANLRGFRFNSRNGTSFALFNSEIRLPIFNMLSAGRVKYKMIRNFQLTAFFDAGAAWHGLTPFSDENIINTLTLESPPTVVVNVKYFRDPLIYGYGIGARTSLFGYFVKLDYGWGVETRIVQKPRLYLSFGMDF